MVGALPQFRRVTIPPATAATVCCGSGIPLVPQKTEVEGVFFVSMMVFPGLQFPFFIGEFRKPGVAVEILVDDRQVDSVDDSPAQGQGIYFGSSGYKYFLLPFGKGDSLVK